MEYFTAGDCDGGYTTVTPLLFIGQPPFEAYGINDPVEGAWRLRAGNTVVVGDSTQAHDVLVEFGMDEVTIERLLRTARYGLFAPPSAGN